MNNKIRLAIIDNEKCKPKKCNKECKKVCPPVSMGKLCIEIEEVAKINEGLCIGCGACIRACPFNAIQIVQIPNEIDKSKMLYTYGENSFRLYKIPHPKIGKIFGIIGENGIGKSSLMGILSGQIKPNFGNYEKNYDDKEIKKNVRGTELQKYFDKLYTGKMIIKIKPQNIDGIQKNYRKKKPETTLIDILKKYYDESNEFHVEILEKLDLTNILEYKIKNLSGGEMQRLVCAIILMQDADVYIFDEPTNYLDIKQRLAVSNLIRKLIKINRYIFVVEHDMSILDYTSDIISIMYGKPAAYGVVSIPHGTAEAINMFFSGYIHSENMRFRNESYNFDCSVILRCEDSGNNDEKNFGLDYESKIINYDNFQLSIKGGNILSNTSMVILVGKNGTGKTTFLNNLADELNLSVSYKNQYVDITKYKNLDGTFPLVKDLLYKKIKKSMCSEMFKSDVLNPFKIERIYDKKVNKLSGGELQRLSIVLCLGLNTDVYLIDEPSASLDIEQRVIATKIIKRFLIHNGKIGFIVEHDIMMAMTMGIEDSSKIIVFREINSENKRICSATEPLVFNEGINIFLEDMGITFRTDLKLKRPRINKLGSQKDYEQKLKGKYYV